MWLDQIERWLARNDSDSEDLWAVLTALRSCDRDEDYKTALDRKYRVTVPIRRAAFPRLAANYNDVDFAIFTTPRGEGYTSRRVDLSKHESAIPMTHFFSHAVHAAGALGLRVTLAKSTPRRRRPQNKKRTAK